jgi:hypothetical protein
LQASRKRSFVDKASITPSKMTDNTTKLISVAFYNRQNQIFITGNFYHFNGALSKSNKRYIYSNNPPYNYSFSYFYDHDWRPTYTTITVGGITQQINVIGILFIA